MEVLKDIKHHLSNDLTLFETRFRDTLYSDNELLRSSVDHFLAKEGKRIRPLLVLLSARLCRSFVSDVTISGAVALELLHSASLIHDDVVDYTMERRGLPSMNAVFNNKVAVLVGDFFLSSALISAVSTQSLPVMNAISMLSRQLTVGELNQLSASRGREVSEELYFSVIEKKTASLFAACFQIGALSVDAIPEQVDALTEYGRLMGLCFQIQDDIFDYFDGEKIGKPSGNDIREGKITLPLLYAMQRADREELERVTEMISAEECSSEYVAYLIEFAKRMGGIEYARSVMQRFYKQAVEVIGIFPDSTERALLMRCFSFVIEREY